MQDNYSLISAAGATHLPAAACHIAGSRGNATSPERETLWGEDCEKLSLGEKFKPRVRLCCSYVFSLYSAVCLSPDLGMLRPADRSSVHKSPSGFLRLGGQQAGWYTAGQARTSSGWHPGSQIPERPHHGLPYARFALQLYRIIES